MHLFIFYDKTLYFSDDLINSVNNNCLIISLHIADSFSLIPAVVIVLVYYSFNFFPITYICSEITASITISQDKLYGHVYHMNW